VRLWVAPGLSVATLCGSLCAQPSLPFPTANPDPATEDATSPQRPTTALKPVEIKGSSGTEMRRQSTAAKIIIGRDEIELYGDTSMGELLKRLPGITVQGRPGGSVALVVSRRKELLAWLGDQAARL